MATAKHLHLHLKDSSAPNIDVYSTPVIVYQGEIFDWTISGQDGQASVTVEPVSVQSWPFSQSSFSVSRGNGTQATVNGAPGTYEFQCSPAAPTSPQTLIVAQVFGQCSDPQASSGGYFAWQNSQNAAILIKAARGVTWPLVQSEPVVILGNSTVIVQVLSNATVGDYGIRVTMQQGGSGVCPQAGDPRIIVTAPNDPK
ncbi:MAG: hypothetical protein WA672_16225 [Candidatus Angelobacter sp.]